MSARVLVVDDTPANLRLMRSKLKASFYQVDCVNSGKEALETLQEGNHDIVLLDVMMPVMNGYEVCRQIKQNPETQQVAVVMVTALQDPESRIKGLEAGADDFLSRPVRDDILFARLRSLERLNSLTRQVESRLKTANKLGFQAKIPALSDFNAEKASILIVEPDDAKASYLAESLEKSLGAIATVHEEPLGPTGLPPNLQPDLLLVNADQAHANDGLHAAASFKTNPATRNSPVVLIFDNDDPLRVEAALQAGVSDYVFADADACELAARVKTQIRKLRYVQQLELLFESSIEMALTDGLTGLHNRRYASQHLPTLVEDAQADNRPVALLMIDTDDFKTINDENGHAAGDLMLREIAQTLKDNLRDVDLVARWGGDEFVVLLPDCESKLAGQLAQRLTKVAKKIKLQTESGKLRTSITVGGASTSSPGSKNSDWLELLRLADRALYDAKAKKKGSAKIV